jgi:hypothetical protein
VPASRLLTLLLLLALSSASAAQERRRAGQTVDRDAVEDLRPEPTPPLRERPAAKPRGLPTLPRRRPGQATVAPLPDDPVTSSGQRRRPGGMIGNRPDAEGRRADPAAPAGPRRAFSPNRRSGLLPVAKPAVDAVYGKERVADRWQLTRQLGLSDYPRYDPYNQNTLKADRPVHGDWFFSLGMISDSILEPRRVPTPVGAQGEAAAGQLDVIGESEQTVFAHTAILALVYYQGNTTFKPPDWEFRLTLAHQYNFVEAEQARFLRVDPRAGTERSDNHLAVQEAFVDYHIRNVSTRYDFDSLRLGIQPFTVDFRGFLFQDLQLGARLFGTRRNNIFQYNLAAFRRLEKDTNSGLNHLGKALREDDVFVANLYWQDLPVKGYFSQLALVHNRNREGDAGSYFNENRFIERPASLGRESPRNYDVTYLGFNGDGHLGRLNLTHSVYYAFGDADRGVFVETPTQIRALFAAAEASVDFDWRRVKLSALWASGDDDPFDDRETGFDAIFENPLFAGFDTSYWIRQNVPLIGGGRVGLSGRNGVLNSLRSSKEEGQSNFSNPGTMLLGLGTDLDLTPTFRLSFNANQLWFVDTAVVEVARQQAGIDRAIGTDLSVATIWRPFMTQNVVLRASLAALLPGRGFRQLYGDETQYSGLLNLVLTY